MRFFGQLYLALDYFLVSLYHLLLNVVSSITGWNNFKCAKVAHAMAILANCILLTIVNLPHLDIFRLIASIWFVTTLIYGAVLIARYSRSVQDHPETLGNEQIYFEIVSLRVSAGMGMIILSILSWRLTPFTLIWPASLYFATDIRPNRPSLVTRSARSVKRLLASIPRPSLVPPPHPA